MSRTKWEGLPLEQKNDVRRVANTVEREAMAHVGRVLEREIGILPEEGPVTVDARWLRGFAKRWQEGGYPATVNTDYIFERGIQALDQGQS